MVAFDTSEMRAFAADMRALPEELNRHLPPIVERGALNIKSRMVADMSGSTHFKPIARTISYDVRRLGWGDEAVVEAEIGPDSGRGDSARLANIAYFGSSRAGGATVADPQSALDEEAPAFVAELEGLMSEIFG